MSSRAQALWCRIHLWKCMCVCFAHAKDEGSPCNVLMWWLAAWGGWSNSLSRANSKLTSQRCHLLVLAYSPMGQSQSKPISQALGLSTPPTPSTKEKSFQTSSFPPFPWKGLKTEVWRDCMLISPYHWRASCLTRNIKYTRLSRLSNALK